jgi:hypothetical protein
MTTTPRDTETVLSSLETTTRDVNPSLDTQKGALSTIYWAVASETSKTEAQCAYLQSIYQLDNPTLIDDSDMFKLARNFGQEPMRARASRGTVWFFRNSRPEAGMMYWAYAGTVVSTTDSRFNYAVTVTGTMNGDNAEAYYNSTTRRYEIPVEVEAVAEGSDYDLPPNTIINISTSQEDWDGCVNTEYMRRGADPVDKFQLRDILYSKMQGLDSTVEGNLTTIVSDTDPFAYDDLQIVPSSDLTAFVRHAYLTDKMGTDVYIITDNVSSTSQYGVAAGGETEVILDHAPLYAIIYCLVDGLAVPFSASYDTSAALQGSSRATDKIVFTSALQPAQTYEIRYQYYDLIYDVNQRVTGRERQFGTDVLYRRATPIPVWIEGQITTFANQAAGVSVDYVSEFATRYLRNPSDPNGTSKQTFVGSLDPYDFQTKVEQNVNGITQFRLTKFVRMDNYSMDVEYISFNGKTEYPMLSPLFNVT